MSVTEVWMQVKALTPTERITLRQLLDQLIASDDEGKPSRSLMELCGLGKEYWQGVDNDAYLNMLRNEWDRDC